MTTGLDTARPRVGITGPAGSLVVMQHFWLWYRSNWRATAVSGVLQPLLMLLAFGLAFGSLVPRGAATGDVDYLVYLAPGLLAMTAVQIGAAEASYPVLACFKWQRTYFAMCAAPLTAAHIVTGHLAWITLRMFGSCAIYLVVVAIFGGAPGIGVLGSLVFATLCGLAVTAPVMAFAACVRNEGSKFGVLFRFVILPMTLVAGTFFPVSQLPAWVRPVAWASPLWHGTELARGSALGTLRLPATLGHTGYLLAFVLVGTGLAVWRYRVRLYV